MNSNSKPVYLIIELEILDKQLYAEYMERVPAVIAKYGGRYLVRGGQVTALAGDWTPERIVIVEFRSAEACKIFLASPEYKEVAPLRRQSARTRTISVEGY